MLRCLLSLLVYFSPVLALSAHGDDWRYSDIIKLIEDRSRSESPMRSVDDLLAALPEGLRKNFTFVYATNNKFQDASYEHPRALVFSNNLVFTFNGNPTQKGYNSIELMEFDEKARRLELREINFIEKDGHKLIEYSTSTPRKCMECHGSDPKPLWQEYSRWRGVYGSLDDTLPAAEREKYIAFLNSVRTDSHSRYRHLIFPTGSTLTPYSQKDYPEYSGRFRINLLLSKLLNRFNSIRTARIAAVSPYYESYKYIVQIYLESLFRCRPDPSLEAKLKTHLDAVIAERGFRVRPKAPLVENLMTILDLPIQRYSSDPAARGYDFQDGSKKQSELMANLLLRDLQKSDPNLSQVTFYTTMHKDRYKAYELYQRIDQMVPVVEDAANPELCALLNRKALSQLNNVKLPDVPHTGDRFEEQLRLAEEVRADPAIPLSCVFCHAVKDGVAPSIAFDDAGRLAKDLAQDSKRLLNAIKRRAHPAATASIAMPPVNHPDFAGLSMNQYRDLVQYLDALSRTK